MRICRCIFLFILFAAKSVSAQYRDAGMWLSAGVSARLNKSFDASVVPEIRLNENISAWQSLFSDFGLEYKLSKNFFTTYTHRMGIRNRDTYTELRNRGQLGFGIKLKWREFSFTLQTRYQLSIDAARSENDPDFTSTFRTKGQIKYSGIKKTELSASYEVFNNSSQYGGFEWQNWRAAIQVERKYKKVNFISVGYLIQRDLTSKIPETDYIVTANFKRELDFRKKKKSPETAPAEGSPKR